MSNKFETTQELPERDCTRENIYDLLRTMDHGTGGVDNLTLQVLAGVLSARYAVPRWKKFTVTHTQLQAAATTNNITLFTLPGHGVIHAVKMKHSAAFTGGAISAYTINIGITDNLTKYTIPHNVFQAPGDTVMQLDTTAGFETANSSGKDIKIAATSTGANLSASTAGSIDVWVLYSVTEAE